jgi:alpha-tubulin suppressor-like RCC1 family protein
MKRLFTIFIFAFIFQLSSFAQCFTKISAGDAHTLALKSDGSLWACGSNSYGELGNGTTSSTPKLTFTKIGNATDWAIIEAGSDLSFGIKKDGSLWAWGSNVNVALGDGTKVSKSTPVKIESDQSWKSVSAYETHVLGIKTDGTLWAWGENGLYQLGLNSTTDRPKPVQVGTEKDWDLIAAGKDFSLATKKDGSLWTWGSNYYYGLGSGVLSGTSKVPKMVDSGIYKSISAVEYHAAGVQSIGSLWTWGDNLWGQIGDGTIATYSPYPLQIGEESEWADVKVGTVITVGLKKDGTLWTWGGNTFGQTGTGYWSNKPVKVNIKAKITSFEVGHDNTFAIDEKGEIWHWGRNSGGGLGTGVTGNVKIPQLLKCPTVGVNDEKISNLTLTLYPNPVEDALFIDFDDEKNERLELTISDILGKTVYRQSSFERNTTINTTSLPKGCYVVTLSNKNNIGFKKFNKI